MNKFSEKKEETPPEGIEIEGAFVCQTCDECVDDAMLLVHSGIIAWICSEGHRSKIQGFGNGG